MITPDLWPAIDATWPAATQVQHGPFMWREGAGGGSRVSAARAINRVDSSGLDTIERKFSDQNRTPLFQLRKKDTAFDTLLAARGYVISDPTLCLIAPTDAFVPPQFETAYACWPPIAVQRQIWHAGGVDTSRLNVMARATSPKTTWLARHGETPAGTAFVATFGSISVLHALEVAPTCRRSGVGATLMSHAAYWAKDNGATTLAVLVTRANSAALALYSSLGMQEADHYHYRRKGQI